MIDRGYRWFERHHNWLWLLAIPALAVFVWVKALERTPPARVIDVVSVKNAAPGKRVEMWIEVDRQRALDHHCNMTIYRTVTDAKRWKEELRTVRVSFKDLIARSQAAISRAPIRFRVPSWMNPGAGFYASEIVYSCHAVNFQLFGHQLNLIGYQVSLFVEPIPFVIEDPKKVTLSKMIFGE